MNPLDPLRQNLLLQLEAIHQRIASEPSAVETEHLARAEQALIEALLAIESEAEDELQISRVLH